MLRLVLEASLNLRYKAPTQDMKKINIHKKRLQFIIYYYKLIYIYMKKNIMGPIHSLLFSFSTSLSNISLVFESNHGIKVP